LSSDRILTRLARIYEGTTGQPHSGVEWSGEWDWYERRNKSDPNPPSNGTRLRLLLLARKDETYPRKDHWRVQELAVAKQRQIEEWEKVAETATAEPAAPG
jgi:hypothetical protein